MEFLTLQRADRFGIASFVESREEIIDVVRAGLCVVGHRLDQLFNQGAQRDLSGVCNAFGAPISVIINFQDYLFHTLKLTAKSGRVKVRGSGQVGQHGFIKKAVFVMKSRMIRMRALMS